MLKQHLDMIGRNEPIQRKAKFWQSYVRALKGTDDMKAPEQSHYSRPRGIFRPLPDFPAWPKSIYDDPIHPGDRITVPGYRYLPISREIYGISPRNIYPHHYSSVDRYPRQDEPMDPLKVMEDAEAYERRLEEIDELLPLKYRYPKTYRPPSYVYDRAGSLPPTRASSVPPMRASSVPPLTTPPLRAMTPLRTYTPPPRYPSEKVGYSYAGLPIYSRGPLGRRALSELLEPSTWLPRSRITGDPWWWDYPSLRPHYSPLYYGRSPYYLRTSYLSPIKRTYLWGLHPLRPFTYSYFWE